MQEASSLAIFPDKSAECASRRVAAVETLRCLLTLKMALVGTTRFDVSTFNLLESAGGWH
jgi:hypothetical protein